MSGLHRCGVVLSTSTNTVLHFCVCINNEEFKTLKVDNVQSQEAGKRALSHAGSPGSHSGLQTYVIYVASQGSYCIKDMVVAGTCANEAPPGKGPLLYESKIYSNVFQLSRTHWEADAQAET